MARHKSDQKKYERRFDPEAIRERTTKRLIRYAVTSVFLMIVLYIAGLLAMTTAVGVDRTRENFDWGMMEGLTGLASVVIVIGGAVFVSKEYIDNEMQGTLVAAEAAFNMYRDIFARITDPDETAARRWIIQNITPLPDEHADDRSVRDKWLREMRAQLHEVPEGWHDEIPPGKQHLKRVLNSLDFLGYVQEHYWEMEDDLVEWLSPMIAKVWERIEPYVEDEAAQRKEPDYYKSARDFGKLCVDYRQGQGYGPSNIIPHGL